MQDQRRSKLITRVGRLFLYGSTALLAITISQVMVLLVPMGPGQAQPASYPGTREAIIFLVVLLLFYTSTLSVSFALLKRISWARPAFIMLLGLGILLSSIKLAWTGLVDDSEELPTQGPPPYLLILRVATVLDVLVPLVVIAFFTWLIVKLNSAAVRAEFGRRDQVG